MTRSYFLTIRYLLYLHTHIIKEQIFTQNNYRGVSYAWNMTFHLCLFFLGAVGSLVSTRGVYVLFFCRSIPVPIFDLYPFACFLPSTNQTSS